MASSNEQKFPHQSQQTHPGQQQVMDPTPQSIIPGYNPSNKLRGKVALVTGGDSGIGRAVCISFAKEGATMAFTYVKRKEDKDKDDTLQILRQLQAADAKEPMAMASDLGYDDNCKQVIDSGVKEYGRIDILVNNAAEQRMTKSLDDITEARLERVFRTNIFSQFFLLRHAVKHMKQGSSIINSTSVNAYGENLMTLEYTATKGAIVAFTRGLALHLVSKGIRVNAVVLGPVWTPLQKASMPPEMIENWGLMFQWIEQLSLLRFHHVTCSWLLFKTLPTSLVKSSIQMAE